jgi:hypothetical protein
MTLTEQLKKGELEQGYYYMQIPTGDIRIITECMKVDCKGFSILSKVPSYEEYSRLEWYAGCGPDRIVELNKENRQLHKFLEEFNALDVAKENQQLKDIISKMCMELVDPDDDMSNGLAEYFNQDLLLEIREVLK